MGNRVYLNQEKQVFVILSYAGGTKYFRHLTETKLRQYVPVNGHSLSPAQVSFDVIQVVREPVSRYMSWFDKQYIKPLYRKNKTGDFTGWINSMITKEWVDNWIKTARYLCHYDGHTAFQSMWPKVNMPFLYRDDWKYLEMENINPYFLGEPKKDLIRDPNEYTGVWEVLDQNVQQHMIDCLKDMYAYEIDWYNNLKFIQPK